MKSTLDSTIYLLTEKLGEGVNLGKWFVTKEGESYRIKRQITTPPPDRKRSFQRLSRLFYKDFNREELRQFVLRLNGVDEKKEIALKTLLLTNAFFPPSLLAAYMQKLEMEIPSKQAASYTYRYAIEHFLRFFLPQSPDPKVWYQKLQPAWAEYLIQRKLSPSVLKKIVNSANRLMAFMHNSRPDEIPLMVFRPLSKSVIAKIRANRELAGEGREKRKYMSELDYSIVVRSLPDHLVSIFQLCYKYGLRRNEALGLYGRQDKVRKGYILINEQLDRITNGKALLKPPKFNKNRKVNHWCATPEECFQLIKNIQLISSDRASKDFSEVTKRLHKDEKIAHAYVLHDLRHTFISNAVKNHDINTVSRAVGHSNISITNEYLKDTRNIDDDIFEPISA